MISSNRFNLICAGLMIGAGAIYFARKPETHSAAPAALTLTPSTDSAAEASPHPTSQAKAQEQSQQESQPKAQSDLAATSLSPQERDQLRVLDEVLGQSTDNDPRLDKELRVLSPRVRAELRSRYHQVAAEKRNSRGTVVFLLGRNLKEPRDLEFLKDVLAEPPCLSLADCRTAPTLAAEDDHAAGMSIALAYPQLVALHSISRLLEQDAKLATQPAMKNKIVEVVRAGLASQIPDVATSAREVQRRLR